MSRCLAFSCPAISCPATWSVNFMSCIFMSCCLVRHFHVLLFHALQLGPSISCPAISCPSFSAPPLEAVLGRLLAMSHVCWRVCEDVVRYPILVKNHTDYSYMTKMQFSTIADGDGLPAGCWPYGMASRSERRDLALSDRRGNRGICWSHPSGPVEYKLRTTVHRCLYGDAPSYLVGIDLITPSGAASTRAGLRSAELMTVAVARTLSSTAWRPLFCDGGINKL